MANWWPPFFRRHLQMREEEGGKQTQRPGLLSEKTNGRKHIFCACTKEKPRTSSFLQPPSKGNNLSVQQINSPLFGSCLTDTKRSRGKGPRSSFLRVTVDLLVEVHGTMHWAQQLSSCFRHSPRTGGEGALRQLPAASPLAFAHTQIMLS